MDRRSALATLELDDHASDALIHQVIKDQRAMLEESLAGASSIAQRARWRNEIDQLIEVARVLLPGSAQGAALAQRGMAAADADSEETSIHRPGARRPPAPPVADAGTFDRDSATRVMSTQEGNELTKGDWRNARPPIGAAITDDDKTTLLGDSAAPGGAKKHSILLILSLVGCALLLLLALGYVAWAWFYVPSQLAHQRAQGVQLVTSMVPEISRMSEEGERAHGKVRSLCWLATALAVTGQRNEATPLISTANALIAKSEGAQTHREDLCRLFSAHAAWGDAQGAFGELSTLQTAREQEAQRGKGGSAPVTRTPLHEDNARRSIAIAQARQHQAQQAIGTINGIATAHDDCAVEALCEVMHQAVATGESAQAVAVIPTINQRTKNIPDPTVRAPLLASIADHIQMLQGRGQSAAFLNEATGSLVSLEADTSGYSDIEARKLIANAILLPSALRMGSESKDSFRQKLQVITPQAFDLMIASGAGKGQPDFKNRARASAAVAVAWASLADHWFAGDAKQRSEAAIAKALEFAEQVQPPVKLPGAEQVLAVQNQKEQALIAIVGALASMRSFDRARETCHRITLAENLGTAGELLAYQLGFAGQTDVAEQLVREIPEGEARTRAAVGYLYGLYRLPLEKWW